ncbi:Cryptochrome DASH-like protein [Elsinoe fawcettii]|nr:Cryptochrome DASH-like protein [Elsinoe fawcettii]
MAVKERILIYVLRRDLRVADNPIFHEVSKLAQQSQRPFTHFLPVYIFPANQVEVSGFVSGPGKQSPYPDARSEVGGFWRCGPHRTKFLAESVWDLKKDLERLKSDLTIRVGTVNDAVQSLLQGFAEAKGETEVSAVYMTAEDGVEEKREERDVRKLCGEFKADFKLYKDEKYLVDDRDLPFKDAGELSDVFTSFRKTVEPLRNAPRKTLPTPSSLPPLPSTIPPQFSPFTIPHSLKELISALHSPLSPTMQIPDMPSFPSNVSSAHPFDGGSKTGHERVRHLITSGSMTAYKDTRNGLLGEDFSTKLSAWLALGCITARQVHFYLLDFEDARTDLGKGVQGYGKGENKGTAAVRFELLWRDYMRLCTRKFGPRLFRVEGFRNDQNANWKYVSPLGKGGKAKDDTEKAVLRFLQGKTGTGLIDASQREVFLTGYTSNRARQNVASYLAKHLGIDWRIGAEWYEATLVDYDVSSNWGNWQYVAGVGNDPRGEQRVFNPVKQALDYDGKGDYVRAWVEELRNLGDSGEELMGLFQAWRLSEGQRQNLGLEGVEWVEKPLVRIDFQLNRRGGGSGGRGRGRGRGGGGGGGGGRGKGGMGRRGMMEKGGMIG